MGKGKAIIPIDYTLWDIWEKYEKEHRDDEFNVDKKTFLDICIRFNQRAVDYIIDKGEDFKMPFRLSSIGIRKRKMIDYVNTKMLRVDWATTNKTGIKTYHLNEHTGNFYYRFYWYKHGVGVKGNAAYCFRPRLFDKKRLAKKLLDPERKIDYPLIGNLKRMSLEKQQTLNLL